MLIYKASAVIDGIISLRMFFFLIFLSDLRMNHRICLFIRNVVEKAVDNPEKQDSAGSRWEYMKTMGAYAAALYMAASMKEMPHMMLGSAEYWKKWLETEVDENGEKIGKKQSDS